MGGNLADFAPCCQESAKACLPRGRRAAHQKNQIKNGQMRTKTGPLRRLGQGSGPC